MQEHSEGTGASSHCDLLGNIYEIIPGNLLSLFVPKW